MRLEVIGQRDSNNAMSSYLKRGYKFQSTVNSPMKNFSSQVILKIISHARQRADSFTRVMNFFSIRLRPYIINTIQLEGPSPE